MGLAYRELIGSLYESWTIGIERVYKYLTHNIIQRYKKWQKEGFDAKERESSPRSHTLLFGDFSQGEGECSDSKRGMWRWKKEKLGTKTYPFKEGVWRWKREEMRNCHILK